MANRTFTPKTNGGLKGTEVSTRLDVEIDPANFSAASAIAVTDSLVLGTSGNVLYKVLVEKLFDLVCPPGTIRPAGYVTDAPAAHGWVLCDGRALSRSTYSRLFAAIGTTFGAGDGSTTFNVPGLTNKVLRGHNATLNNPTGADSATLSANNIPQHSHSITTSGTHDHNGSTDTVANHDHDGSAASSGAHDHSGWANADNGSHTHDLSLPVGTGTGSGAVPGASYATTMNLSTGGESAQHGHSIYAQSAGAHTHTVDTNAAGSHSHTVDTTVGGDHAHGGNTGNYGQASPTAISTIQASVHVAFYIRA